MPLDDMKHSLYLIMDYPCCVTGMGITKVS